MQPNAGELRPAHDTDMLNDCTMHKQFFPCMTCQHVRAIRLQDETRDIQLKCHKRFVR